MIKSISSKTNNFSCYLCGEGSILLQCADILIKKSHRILGIISSDLKIEQWSRDNDISFHKFSKKTLRNLMQQSSCDYLFSIVNNDVLSGATLKLPKQFAINYHDSLLPKYAGINAATWAILERQKVHGITWHVMTEKIDNGDILKQVAFDIDERETSFTINGKCYAAAISAFSELVDELSNRSYKKQKQSQGARTYYSRNKRPINNSVIVWDDDVNNIDSLIRALNFETYQNTLALPKIIIGNNIFYAVEATIEKSNKIVPNGVVVDIDHNCIRISAKNGIICFKKIINLKRDVVLPDFLVKNFAIKVGGKLPIFSSDDLKQISTTESEIARHEPYWMERFINLESVDVPYQKKNILLTKKYFKKKIDIKVEKDLVFACFTTFLAKINRKYSFDINYSDTDLRNTICGFKNHFVEQIPIKINVNFASKFSTNIKCLSQEIIRGKKHLFFTNDLHLRYPEFRHISKNIYTNSLPIAYNIVAKIDEYFDINCSLVLFFEKETNQMYLYGDTGCFDEKDFLIMCDQLKIFIKNALMHYEVIISKISLVSTEQQFILAGFNKTDVNYKTTKCIHQIIYDQAKRTPDAVALVFENKSITYKELITYAESLASYLKNSGIKNGDRVGVCIERSFEMVIALLGILMVGAAYVPIDPDYPEERIKFIQEDANIGVLLNIFLPIMRRKFFLNLTR